MEDYTTRLARGEKFGKLDPHLTDQLTHHVTQGRDWVKGYKYTMTNERRNLLTHLATDPVTGHVNTNKLNALIHHDQHLHLTHRFGSQRELDAFRELENRVIEVLMRVRDKQERAEELSNDLQDMDARQQQQSQQSS